MEKIILWGQEIEKCFIKVSEDQLDEFLELARYIQINNIQNMICEKTWENPNLWDWLCSKNEIELNDMKRELMRRIEKAERVGENEFNHILNRVGQSTPVKTLVFLFDDDNVYYVSTISEYYTGIRAYLLMEKKDEFCKDLQECFPNIFFDQGIETSINTLNRKFEEIREEIVEHLIHINDYRTKFWELLKEHKSYPEIAQRFSADTGIDCSPQAGRESVQLLKGKYLNSDGQEETVTCELHTKFKKFNINREKQDRIYFCPGKQGILDEKVIVKYIGTHL